MGWDNVSVGERLDSRFHGNDGIGERKFGNQICLFGVSPECIYRGSTVREPHGAEGTRRAVLTTTLTHSIELRVMVRKIEP